MEVLAIFCFIVVVVCWAVTSFMSGIKPFKAGVICGIGIYSFIVCFWCGILLDNPTALDVYRGRTTLEITYKDSVSIDSVVVFKKD